MKMELHEIYDEICRLDILVNSLVCGYIKKKDVDDAKEDITKTLYFLRRLYRDNSGFDYIAEG